MTGIQVDWYTDAFGVTGIQVDWYTKYTGIQVDWYTGILLQHFYFYFSFNFVIISFCSYTWVINLLCL